MKVGIAKKFLSKWEKIVDILQVIGRSITINYASCYAKLTEPAWWISYINYRNIYFLEFQNFSFYWV